MSEQLVQYKKELAQLRDAYADILVVYHSCRHYTVMRSVEVAVNELNRAIKTLEDAIIAKEEAAWGDK